MSEEFGLSRRSLVTATGAVALAPLIASAAPPSRSSVVRAEEHWVTKGAVRLYVYRKVVSPSAGKPVVFLVHGSSFSSRASFDLKVPGQSGYSVMDWLARAGFDVWTMDHENYGRSSKTAELSGINSGADDLAVAFPLVERVTGQKAWMVYGQSSGALRAGVFAMRSADRVSRLILDAFSYTGANAPEIIRRREQVNNYRVARFRPMTQATIAAVFSRDDASLFDPAVAMAIASSEMALTDRIPNGTYIDMATLLPLVDPARITCPVLITRAEADANATLDELLDFFAKLPSKDRQFAIMGHVAHVAMLGTQRMKLWTLIADFFRYPNVENA